MVIVGGSDMLVAAKYIAVAQWRACRGSGEGWDVGTGTGGVLRALGCIPLFHNCNMLF
jgi:hypothetical protein